MSDEHYLLYVWRSTGYGLEERVGELPAVGSDLVVDDVVLTVLKIAASPLPGDPRPCVYLQPA